jgi:hypothetical protein
MFSTPDRAAWLSDSILKSHKLYVVLLVLGSLFCASASLALTFDFDVANGNYNVAANWVDETAANGVPGAADEAHVRNGGTAILNDNQAAATLRLGRSKEIEDPNQPYIEDPDNLGTFIPDPDNLLPPIEVGGDGTLEWTAGTLSTNDLRVGHLHQGIVNQSGGDITFVTGGNFTIGDGDNETSEYNMTGGTIRLAVGAPSNNGINVRRGSFNMSGGQIVDATPLPLLFGQRFLRVASTGDAVASATFSGDAQVEVRGGVRVADSGGAMGTLNIISPDVFIGTAESDFSIGRNETATGIMNMSAGTLRVGLVPDHEAHLKIGQDGYGELNLSGGMITVTDDLVVGEKPEAIGSFINMTGGTLVTTKVVIREEAVPIGTDPGGTYILINGPSASFAENDSGTTIGQEGVALFEVRQGAASLTEVELGESDMSQGTLAVTGGKLTINGDVNKSDPAANSTVNLTGGMLETTAAGGLNWQLDLINNGTELTLGPGARQVVSLGDVERPADFAMTAGLWNVELRSSDTNGGADLINVLNGAGGITGGELNISYIESYVPSLGDTIRIVRSALGDITLDPGAIVLSGEPNWSVHTFFPGDGTGEIRLTYVPEPGSSVLVVAGLLGAFVWSRRTGRQLGHR